MPRVKPAKQLATTVTTERTGPCTIRRQQNGRVWRCDCQGWARWSQVDLWWQCRCGHTQAVHQLQEVAR